MNREDIREHYKDRNEEIEDRLQDFSRLRNASNKRLFKELVFVILTSQSGAENSWKAAEELDKRGLLEEGDEKQIAEVLQDHSIQYEENKARYIVENRQKLSQPTLEDPEKGIKLKRKIDPEELEKTREWLVDNIKGISWKGASHFLRNIGYGDEFAIVSGYISRALHQLGLLSSAEQPKNKEEYLEAEEKMKQLAEDLEIDIKALDLVLWSMKTGEVFK